MGFIVLTSIAYPVAPAGTVIGDIFYKLASDPDVTGSYTEVFSNVIFNADGSIVGGPKTITGLTNGVTYTVKVQFDCNLASFIKDIPVPAVTTTTTSTTTTLPAATLTIQSCGGTINHNSSLFITFSTIGSVAVNTDVTVNFTATGTQTGGGAKTQNLSTVIDNGSYQKLYAGSASNWATLTNVTITSISPTTSGSYTYVAGTYGGDCS